MFNILSRPPFDQFTFNLFKDLYVNRRNYNLLNAEFIYTWTGFMSHEKGIVSLGHGLDLKNIDIRRFFYKYGYDIVVGEKKYCTDDDELYARFLSEYPDNITNNTKHEFLQTINLIHKNLFDRKQIEQKLHDIINCRNEIVIFVKDHFRVKNDNSWKSMNTEIGEYFKNLSDYFSNKRFIIFTSLENLEHEIQRENVTIIPIGGDITNQSLQYSEYTFVTDKIYKNFNYCSYNRGIRNHRTYLVSSLYGNDLENYGDISYIGVDKHNDSYRKLITEFKYNKKLYVGFNKFFSHEKTYDDYDIYKDSQNNNLVNYNTQLANKYVNTYVEFVADTSFNEYGFNITEKFLHSINGSNLPIIVSSPGYVSKLREIGFDVFDDIVNHDYDNIIDPYQRIEKCINDNIELITTNKASKLYNNNLSRFRKNRLHVENNLLMYYTNRFYNEIKKL